MVEGALTIRKLDENCEYHGLITMYLNTRELCHAVEASTYIGDFLVNKLF